MDEATFGMVIMGLMMLIMLLGIGAMYYDTVKDLKKRK